MSRAQSDMRQDGDRRMGVIGALGVLLGCELMGEALRGVAGLPVPGPVLGMLLLAVALVLRGSLRPAGEPQATTPSDLDRTADALVSHMGLLFVPAGVGVIAQAPLLKAEWPPILGGVLGSTLLSLIVTALVMQLTIGREHEPSHGTPERNGGLP